jgi:hypothetical protein
MRLFLRPSQALACHDRIPRFEAAYTHPPATICTKHKPIAVPRRSALAVHLECNACRTPRLETSIYSPDHAALVPAASALCPCRFIHDVPMNTAGKTRGRIRSGRSLSAAMKVAMTAGETGDSSRSSHQHDVQVVASGN